MQIAESIDDPAKLGMFYAWYGFVHLGDDNKKAMSILLKALQVGESLGDQRIIGYACTWLPWICGDLGLYAKGIQYGTRAQTISKIVESDHYLYFKSLGGIAMCYWYLGDSKQLFEIGNDLIEYGQKHANIRSQTMGHMMLGAANNLVGNNSKTIKCLQKACEVTADTMYEISAKTFLGMIYLLDDQIDRAEIPLKEVVSFCEQNDFDWAGTPGQIFLGVVTISKGNISQGFKLIKRALEKLIRSDRKYYIALAEYILGKIYSQIVEGSSAINPLNIAKNIGFLVKNVPFADRKAETHFKKAIEVAESIGAKNLLGQINRDLAILYKVKNRKDQAEESISKAIALFEECEANIYLKQAKDDLVSLRGM